MLRHDGEGSRVPSESEEPPEVARVWLNKLNQHGVVVDFNSFLCVLLDLGAEADRWSDVAQGVNSVDHIVSGEGFAVAPHNLRAKFDCQFGKIGVVLIALSLPHGGLVVKGVPVGHPLPI